MAEVIEIVSDVVCPWCYIGKRRLQKALLLLNRPDVQVRWKPFELNPAAPKEGMDRRAYRTRKFGSWEYARQLENQVAAAGAEEGLEFRFDRIKRVPNTFAAHRMIWLAVRQDVQDAVVEHLFRAYFVDALDVGSPDVLQEIAQAHGLDFSDEVGAAEVREEESRAREHAVSGVPTFFIDGQPVVSGAQAPQVLAGVLGAALGQCSLADGSCR